MEIKILGTGCAKCRAMFQLTEQAVNELRLEASVVKEEDILKIISYKVLGLPALFVACGNGAKKKAVSEEKSQLTGDRVEVLYFHGAQRCVTCNAIEAETKALLDSVYAKEIKAGKVVFKEVDISKKENEKLADKYEVTWSSLFVNGWKEGQETVNNMTDFAFSYVKAAPDTFRKGVREKVDSLLR